MRQKVRTGKLSSYLICTLIIDLLFVLGLIFYSNPPKLEDELKYIFNDYLTWSNCLWDYFLLYILRFIACFFSLCGTRQRTLTYMGATLQCVYFIVKFLIVVIEGGVDKSEVTRILLVLEGIVFVILEAAIVERIFKHTARRLVFHNKKKPLLEDDELQNDSIIVDVGKQQQQQGGVGCSNQDDSDDGEDIFEDTKSEITNASFHSAVSFNTNRSSSSSFTNKQRGFFFFRPHS